MRKTPQVKPFITERQLYNRMRNWAAGWTVITLALGGIAVLEKNWILLIPVALLAVCCGMFWQAMYWERIFLPPNDKT